MSAPLLLHSLSEFRSVLLRCFDVVGARALAEIGSESGAFTLELLQYARDRGGSLTCVEPFPTNEVLQLEQDDEAFRLVQGLSPGALEGLGAFDAWIIDGDHNYWTVTRELDAALDAAAGDERPPLIVLHDVCWPWARRDLYYDASALPREGVRPHTLTHGVTPGNSEIVEHGFRGSGEFAIAVTEGGERNGVLTAVEDVMAARGGLTLAILPAIYGVGVLYPSDASWAEDVTTVLAPYERLDLLRRLEENRLALYMRVLELQDRLSRADRARNRVLASYDGRIAELEAENARLRVENARRDAAA